MKHLLYLLFILVAGLSFAQTRNVAGRWYGYALQDTLQDTTEKCSKCDFILDLAGKKSFWGSTHTTKEKEFDLKVSVSGFFNKDDSLQLTEMENMFQIKWIRDWQSAPCIRQIWLKHQVINGQEYLVGRGIGERLNDNNTRSGDWCIPALFYFARSPEALERYLADNVNTQSRTASTLPGSSTTAERSADSEPLPEFGPQFENTLVKKVTEVIVEHLDVKIQIRDYLREDNDTISVYLNRKLLAGKQRISKKELVYPIRIKPGVSNEVLIYAENLGLVPPNTSEMYVIDGKRAHRIMIESDKQKTAAVYLRYKPKP